MQGGPKEFGMFLKTDGSKMNPASCVFIFRHDVGGILLTIGWL